ncbi:hypothetical protein LZG04_28710 [Saccharothrix sp. S26]|uniref:hypothetical protein n=1 Tax=Saccharothrix sp. S26 TaxID=2907215 RepID=UPI001F1D7979|nr:hypothetical protein [Saccharothrix sp. S26]MCE6998748.1 hypothetical protein [Saccharothrix sp. S26]
MEPAGAPRRTHVLESAGNDSGPRTCRGILNLLPDNGWAIDGAVLMPNGALCSRYSAFHADGPQSIHRVPGSSPISVSAFGTLISASASASAPAPASVPAPALAREWEGQPVTERPFALQRGGRTFPTCSAGCCGTRDDKLVMPEYRGSAPLSASS